MDESGSVSMMSGCLEQGIDKTAQCNQTSDFTCCSRGDYCNDYLVASVPMESTSTPVQTEQGTYSMYCTTLDCTVMYCTVLYCNVLYCVVLYCVVLYCVVLYCVVLYCVVLYCIVL